MEKYKLDIAANGDSKFREATALRRLSTTPGTFAKIGQGAENVIKGTVKAVAVVLSGAYGAVEGLFKGGAKGVKNAGVSKDGYKS